MLQKLLKSIIACRIAPKRGSVLKSPTPAYPLFSPHRATLASGLRVLLGAAALLLLAACASTHKTSGGAASDSSSSAPLESNEYRVRPGDTLNKIAREHGQSPAALLRMNSLSNGNRIYVGQVLKVGAGGAATARATSKQRAAPSRNRAEPEERPSAPVGNIALAWPAAGNVARKFDGGNAKGIDIAGSAGAPVLAAAPGDVAYVGDALRGYGNLVILRHAGNFMTVYAHNQKLLVKEGQAVKQGQKIAEMGSHLGKPALYFEVRAGGKPADPMRYLPNR
jgi:murein DD-endopeptidase MepM/ murein hydrolase activator NlpD